MQVIDQSEFPPRKRAAMGDGISAESQSPCRDSESPPPRRSNARPLGGFRSSSGSETEPQNMLDVVESDIKHHSFDTRQRPPAARKLLWGPDDARPAEGNFELSNTVSVQKNRSKTALQTRSFKAYQSPQSLSPRNPIPSGPTSFPTAILSSRPAASMLDHAGQYEEIYDIIMQPEPRPISQEQLVAEVRGIYAGLVMVEAKCIEVDSKQATLGQIDGPQSKLNNEQWQALIALHRTLLHEHHDFFLASQHPSASPALRRLASKYAMPARMWRHGIHSFLELLRHRLPASIDHMLAFIYLAYSMMALLYETVPAFEDTWIECLGDLGRYRMAIEDDDIRDREVWTGVARHWYSKASDKAPTTGRLYHHLAILARPNALRQLYYYAKSLCVVVPFTSAKESVLMLFEPVLSENNQNQYRLPPLDTAFVKAQGLLFTNREIDKFDEGLLELLRLLSAQIGRVTRKFMEQGCHISIANSVAMLGWASHENPLMKAITPGSTSEGASANDLSLSRITFEKAMHLSNSALDIVLDRIGDPNVLPYIHCTLVFMLCMSRHPAAMKLLEADFPFEKLKRQLNTFEKSDRITNETFPLPEKNDSRPLPEDFALRGLSWADNYFPDTWFTGDKIDEEEKYQERPSMTAQRKERIKWIAYRIITPDGKLQYDSEKSEFHVRKEFDVCDRSKSPATDGTTEVSSEEDASSDVTYQEPLEGIHIFAKEMVAMNKEVTTRIY
ncbi:hypothetical protein B0O99DRAFT_556359 [Bisporella sp. PMI_857]|nr:hypothetical protein B0O99DRAFT_556359 [Bisporella sp. PMI_857]